MLVSIKNTRIPISYSFGASKTKPLYMRLFSTFQKILHIDLTQYKFLSDQGPAIIELFTNLKIKHYICLRHFLVTLKFSKYSYTITNIIKCCTLQELQNCLMFYSDVFSYDIDPNDIKKRDKV